MKKAPPPPPPPPAVVPAPSLKKAPPPPPPKATAPTAPLTTTNQVPTAPAAAAAPAALKKVPPPPPHPAIMEHVLKAITTKVLDGLEKKAAATATSPTVKEADELCASLLPSIDVENAEFVQWARCSPTIYNDMSTTNLIRESFGNTAKYGKQQNSAVSRLLMILTAHPEERVRDLATPITDPVTDVTVPKFIHLTQHRKTAAGKAIINTVMILFGLNVSLLDKGSTKMMDITKMSREAIAALQFMPSTHSTMNKQVFSYFNQHGVCFSQREFKGMKGSYHVSHLYRTIFSLSSSPTHSQVFGRIVFV
jgi:hypothetical protein